MGLERGAYHFLTLCAPGEAQARNFLAVAPPVSDALPPAVDHRWESWYPVKERLGREIWQLRVLRRPAEEWLVWQIHGFAHVDGVTGRVDLNIMRGRP